MINFGALQGGGFQNALAMGLQLGQVANQQRQQNQLMQQREVMIANQTRDQQMQEERFAQQQQAAAQEADLTTRALAGDDAALTQLATVNFEKWKSLDTASKTRAREQATIFGNAALDVLQVPAGPQRRDRIVTYAQQFPQLAEQINEIAFLPPNEQETRLRAVVAEANLTERLHRMEQPDYQVLPQGADLVNTRDPQAVAQFAPGGAQGGFAEGQTATNPTTGQRIVFRNGAWRPM